jgi:hypothetical protein
MRRVDRSLLPLNGDTHLPIGTVREEKVVRDEWGGRLAE